MSNILWVLYNHIYTRLPRLLKYQISRLVYKPQIDHKATVAGCPEFHQHVIIGRYSSIQDESFFAQCEIGKYCACAKGVRFLHTQHRIKAFSQLGRLGEMPFCRDTDSSDLKRPGGAIILPVSHIGNDVWLGEFCTVKCGCNIGDGAVIGARAVVTHDIPAYAIAVGVPAVVKGYRFEPDIIQRFEDIKWWDWSESEISDRYDELCSIANGDAKRNEDLDNA